MKKISFSPKSSSHFEGTWNIIRLMWIKRYENFAQNMTKKLLCWTQLDSNLISQATSFEAYWYNKLIFTARCFLAKYDLIITFNLIIYLGF